MSSLLYNVKHYTQRGHFSLKKLTPEAAAALIPEGATIMVGGFMGCGSAHAVLDALSKSGKGDFTIVCNDGSMPGGCLGEELYALAKLIHNGQVKKLITSHIGMNPEAGRLMTGGELEVVFVPQGSLAEMIRAGGAGLGGVITPTGVGTDVEGFEHVYQKITLDGREFLIEKPLRAEWAILGCHIADTLGNAWYRGTMRNMNIVMATAADNVIMECERLVPAGEILPENVHTQSVFVDYLVNEEGYVYG